jgi:hypothetical protein
VDADADKADNHAQGIGSPPSELKTGRRRLSFLKVLNILGVRKNAERVKTVTSIGKLSYA